MLASAVKVENIKPAGLDTGVTCENITITSLKRWRKSVSGTFVLKYKNLTTEVQTFKIDGFKDPLAEDKAFLQAQLTKVKLDVVGKNKMLASAVKTTDIKATNLDPNVTCENITITSQKDEEKSVSGTFVLKYKNLTSKIQKFTIAGFQSKDEYFNEQVQKAQVSIENISIVNMPMNQSIALKLLMLINL